MTGSEPSLLVKRKREKDYQCSGGNSRGRRLVAQALDALHVAPSYDLAIMRGIGDVCNCACLFYKPISVERVETELILSIVCVEKALKDNRSEVKPIYPSRMTCCS